MRFGKPVAVAGAYPLKARRGEQTSSPIICGTEARPMTWWRWPAALLVDAPHGPVATVDGEVLPVLVDRRSGAS